MRRCMSQMVCGAPVPGTVVAVPEMVSGQLRKGGAGPGLAMGLEVVHGWRQALRRRHSISTPRASLFWDTSHTLLLTTRTHRHCERKQSKLLSKGAALQQPRKM